MLQFLEENYYVDFIALEKEVNIPKNEDGKEMNTEKETEKTSEDKFAQHISVVKFETIKMMLEVVLTEREEIDDNLGIRAGTSKSLSIPFKIAFNTLLRHGIIKYI
jgi:PAB1-binding protein PBP1